MYSLTPHSAMALDVYTWVAQRLHRVDASKPAFVPWVSLKEQFGHGYDRMDNFKRVFRTTLRQVAIVYREANSASTGRECACFTATLPLCDASSKSSSLPLCGPPRTTFLATGTYSQFCG